MIVAYCVPNVQYPKLLAGCNFARSLLIAESDLLLENMKFTVNFLQYFSVHIKHVAALLAEALGHGVFISTLFCE